MKRYYILFFLLAISSYSYGQKIDALPVDPRVTTGKLANGLRYYIVKNSVTPGKADFLLLQNLGPIVEPEGSHGMIRMLGNLAVRGTRNFPDKTILSYLETFGIEPGSGLDMDTFEDRTLYRMSGVNVKRSSSVIDSCLLILYNWAGTITIDEEELEREKSLMISTVKSEINANTRMRSVLMDSILKDSRQPFADPDLILNSINYPTRDLRRFYYEWFRPDLQAVIVAGDIDPKDVESKIKTLFQASPKPLNPNTLPDYHVPDNSNVEIRISEDPEMTRSIIKICYKSDPLPDELMNSAMPFFMDFMYDAVSSVLQERLASAFKENKVAVIDFGSEFGKFFGLAEKEAFTITIESDPREVTKVMSVVSQELERIREHGFLQSEIDRYRDKYVKVLDGQYTTRTLIPRERYIEKCVENFIENRTLASIELERELMIHLVTEISRNNFNLFAKSILRRDENLFINVQSPSGLYRYNVDSLRVRYSDGFSKPTEPYNERGGITHIIKGEVTPGTITVESVEPITNSVVWTLSNGATVVIKKSNLEKGRVALKAVGKGGYSLMKPDKIVNGHLINEIFDIGGLGEHSEEAVARYFKNRDITLSSAFSLSEDVLCGGANSEDITQFLQFIHLAFKGKNRDTTAFALYSKAKEGALRLKYNDPAIEFSEKIESLLYNDSRYSSVVDAEMLKDLDYEYSLNFIKERFSNAANYYFILVGDIDPASIRESVCKYLASLPGNPNKKDSWQIVPYYISKYDVFDRFERELLSDKCVHEVVLSSGIPFTAEGIVEADLIYNIFKKHFNAKLSERGIVATMEKKLLRYPEEYFIIYINMISGNPDVNVSQEFDAILNDLMLKGIDEAFFSRIKNNYLLKRNDANSQDNLFWSEIITARYLYGKDIFSKHSEIVKGVNLSRANSMIRRFIDEGHKVELTMTKQQ